MPSVDEQTIDFYYELFGRIFSEPFHPTIKERLKRDAVVRQVQEAAGAASQALTRFFLSQELTEQQVESILRGFAPLHDLLKLEAIANPNRTPEALVEELVAKLPCPSATKSASFDAVYRLSLHLTVQVLMLVGPVMTEWRRLSFSSTYEMPRRIVNQLNQITEGLKALSSSGQAAADERYELAYRDHLLQRFYRVEAGTVRMTTNLNVDLRELFVMPRVTVRPRRKVGDGEGEADADALMNLSAARAIFGEERTPEDTPDSGKKDQGLAAIEQVRDSQLNVIVGAPGGGKSTFLEWLQLSVANADEELFTAEGQMIPLLLRVRQLDAKNLPRGAALIEKATASKERATLMPAGWIDRQMKAGRVLFMLDGLDETEPGVRDRHIIPWLVEICEKYPRCRYLVSSRPVGYPPGALRKLKFAECDLQDFGKPEVADYTKHWCTAIRLAQNEPDEEARREGAKDGEGIVEGFKGHPYIRNLARNPLMLSAICLVNYFEGGQLPKDRAVLYEHCVEGLLHHWDQRRGIHSEFSLDEKLRVSREVAVAMQADDRAEYEAAKVLKVFAAVLGDKERAEKLLEHIRYRTGLLIERRANVFAFAHLTFQEYLAASAVYEGNYLDIDADQLARDHADGRWNEVIALYCGVASAKAARHMLETLIEQPDTVELSSVLTEAYLSAVNELARDTKLRKRVLERVATAPSKTSLLNAQLSRFPADEVFPIANAYLGKIRSSLRLSESYDWLMANEEKIDENLLTKRLLQEWRNLSPFQACEMVHVIHSFGGNKFLIKIASVSGVYLKQGPTFENDVSYVSQAEIALVGLTNRMYRRLRTEKKGSHEDRRRKTFETGTERALIQTLRVLCGQKEFASLTLSSFRGNFSETLYPRATYRMEFISLTRQLADRIETYQGKKGGDFAWPVKFLREWADGLEREGAEGRGKKGGGAKSKAPRKGAAKKTSGRRKE